MSGLDTRGFIDGAMKGFSFVDGYYDKEDAKARQAKLDQENTDYRAQQQDNWQATNDESKRRHGLDIDYRTAQAERSQKNADRSFGLQSAQLKNTQANQAWQRDRTNEEDARIKTERDLAKVWAAAAATGFDESKLTEKEKKILQDNPASSPFRFAKPEMNASAQYLKQVAPQFEQLIAENRPAEEVAQMLNQPQMLSSMNGILGEQLNKGSKGKKHIAAIVPVDVPGPNGEKMIAFHLGIEKEDGTKYEAGLTTNRSDDPKDTIKLFPYQYVADYMGKTVALNDHYQEQAVRFGQASGRLAKPEKASYAAVKLKDAMGEENVAGSFNKSTGEYKKFGSDESAMPPAAENAGRVLVDTDTGVRLKSDGNYWVPVE